MSSELDFDYLSKLYQTDPEKFEELRAKEIEALIESASSKSQTRLRGLQFQIDAQREIHKNSSLGACIAISKMMHESFEELRFHLNEAANIKDPLNHQPLQYEAGASVDASSAKVLQFSR
ncbi:DUF3135 domain-containing protein [Glaciecola sp. SC05]|uniref:DUF3135 domain-containing protein n=1 Tax=Glaciecola sp. SC05 TaxID=1987355 RepID=UPI0035291079